MRELVEYIAKSLVDRPEAVSVRETQGESVTIIEIRTAPEDSGKVIGREGRIANAIRTIVKAAAAKQQKRITVEILTEEKNPPEAEKGEFK
ncbi:KH domain-containing protein [Candidatus Saganbacteria bacterium]|uniref:RNA-binding protein KhpA n=1 Tax=Candidatus Saganbacteria bacterium TaxID=2575572 RepID=A0A9D6ULK7_UNCSA|nr:KH domain-containing protein [Candidatus Saganbacteria bacterium]